MSFQLKNLRERLADVEYEIAKENNKIHFLKDQLLSREKQKEDMAKYNLKWENTYQLGLEQTELEIKIREAVINKFSNEIKFLRLDIESYTK